MDKLLSWLSLHRMCKTFSKWEHGKSQTEKRMQQNKKDGGDVPEEETGWGVVQTPLSGENMRVMLGLGKGSVNRERTHHVSIRTWVRLLKPMEMPGKLSNLPAIPEHGRLGSPSKWLARLAKLMNSRFSRGTLSQNISWREIKEDTWRWPLASTCM